MEEHLEKEEKYSLDYLKKLNYFYAAMVVVMMVLIVFLLGSLAVEQSGIIRDLNAVVEDATELNRKQGQRTEMLIGRLEELEDTILKRLPEDEQYIE